MPSRSPLNLHLAALVKHCLKLFERVLGHNALLRWSAIQQVSYTDEDGYEKFWSESHVSEDFDMALRLQLRGYIIRWATYSQGAFKEGVSLTVDDELNRWQKYAYGAFQE